MLRHYLTMATRSVARHRLYGLINILGLTLALTCITFVILFTRNELSYDKWIPGTQNLYRVELFARLPGRPPFAFATTSYPLGTAMVDQIPAVKGMTRLRSATLTLASGGREFLEKKVDFVDPNFFQMIRLPFIEGSREAALRESESVVVSESTARKYFGDGDPLGQILTVDARSCTSTANACSRHTVSLRVTGVVRDLPPNTQLSGDLFIPTASLADPLPPEARQSWFNNAAFTYIQVAPGIGPDVLLAAMPQILDRDVTGLLRRMGIAWRGSQAYAIHLTPFTDVHLSSSSWEGNLTPAGSWYMVYGVIAVGILIILVACFNFINLATARAELRAREIGLRKTLGAERAQLIFQFLSEAVLLAVASLAVAMALAEILLPGFNGFLHQSTTLDYGRDWRLDLTLLGVALGAGLISGMYPALILSGLRPVAALRAETASVRGSVGLRDVLVLSQFAVSIGLGVAVIVVFRQVDYARSMNLGFRRDNILVIRNGELSGERQEALAQALRTSTAVSDVGLSQSVPFEGGVNVATVQVPGLPSKVTLNSLFVGPEYPRTYGIALVAGRLLSMSRGEDRLASPGVGGAGNVLVNVSGARKLGFTPGNAVGQAVVLDDIYHVHIVGVLADTRTQGAREAVAPKIYAYIPSVPMDFSVRLRGDRMPETLAFIDRTWHAFLPAVAIQRSFLSASFEGLYREDRREGTVFAVFVVIGILIGCLGLYGLVVFTSERRTKEVALRKICGARTYDILKIMLWRTSVPVLLADVIAWPAAYYYLQRWLQGFASHIWLNPVYFVAASAIALLIAWATVLLHTLRLAQSSPVSALRYE